MGPPAGHRSSRTPTPRRRPPAHPPNWRAASDLVCLCVVGDDDVREVLDRRERRAGRAGAGRDRRHPQHRASRHLPRDRRESAAGTGRLGHRRAGQRRRAGRRGGHAAGDGRRRRGRSSERCRPVFATYADPIVHLGPLGSGQVTKILNNLLFTANLGSAISTLELGESLGIAAGTAVRGAHRRVGDQQGARQHRRVRRHAGQARADRRCAAAEGRPARREPRRRPHRRRRARCSMPPTRRWSSMDHRAMSAAWSASSARAAWAHRWCAGSSRPATRCACSAAPTRSARPSPNSAPAGRRSRRGRRRRRGRRGLRVHRRPGARGLPARRSASRRCRPVPSLVVHTTGSPRTAEAIAARGTGVDVSTRRSAAARTTSPPAR